MIKTLKFGGTSVGSAANMRRVAGIILSEGARLTVLSAMSGTTDALVKISAAAKAGDDATAKATLAMLRDKYTTCIAELLTSHAAAASERMEDVLTTIANELFTYRGEVSDKLILAQGELLTSEILRSEIDVAMVRRGMLPTGTICAGGAQAAQPHNTGSGPLRADWPIVMDIFPRSAESGYWGDLTRTVVKGRASELVRRAYDAVLSARELGKSLVKVGAIPAEIHLAAARKMEEAGFRTGRSDKADFGFFHGLGHGVGLDIHEAPRLSPRNRIPLRGGEIVTVEPGLYYPEWGGIRLEDLMYVSPDGPARCLTEAEDFLEIP